MIAVALIFHGRSGTLSWSDLAGRLSAAAEACDGVEHVFLAPPPRHRVELVEVQAVVFVQAADCPAAIDIAVSAVRPVLAEGVSLATATASPCSHGSTLPPIAVVGSD